MLLSVLHFMYKRICLSNYGVWKVNVEYVVKKNNNIICLPYKMFKLLVNLIVYLSIYYLFISITTEHNTSF